MKVRLLYTLIAIILLLSSCRAGYQMETGKWVYVTYDEGAGRRVRKLEVDHKNFEVFGNGNYGRDKKNVFYKGGIIEGANPQTFVVLSENGYAKDDKYLYLEYYIIPLANPKTFEVLKVPYSRDDKKAFCGSIPMQVNDIKSFKVTESSKHLITRPLRHFIRENPDFKWMDTLGVAGIIYGKGRARTETESFLDFKKIG